MLGDAVAEQCHPAYVRGATLLIGATSDLGLTLHGPRGTEADAKKWTTVPPETAEADSWGVELDAHLRRAVSPHRKHFQANARISSPA